MKMELLTTDEVIEAERMAEVNGLSEDILMERAGKNIVEIILAHYSPCRAIVFCGVGKNGGDGQVVARLLKARGWPVEVISLKNPSSTHSLKESLARADLIVDALLGTGLSRPLSGTLSDFVELINSSKKPVIAVDIPTGIDTNSGTCWGKAIQATHTVTFFRPRPGHYLLPGREYVGRLWVTDIGISEQELPLVSCFLNTPSLWEVFLKVPLPLDHKYTRGACLIVGSGCLPGAIRLATLAARRSGAGLVRLLCKAKEYPIFAGSAWGEVVTPLTSPQEFLELIEDMRFKSLLWGPGAPHIPSTREKAILLLSTQKPCVLDGGALSSFEGRMFELAKYLHDKVILTPHEGEFLRLFPHLSFLNNKVEKARKAAAEAGCVIVLKGYDTVIASPQGETIINANAPTTLATAGTGDVLAGLMAGLLAQSLPSFQAAAAAVWIHGEAAQPKGLGLIAEDLLGEIPAILQSLIPQYK